MKKINLIAILFFLSTTAFATKLVDKVVAVVNDDVITLFDLDRAMAPKLGGIKKATDRDTAFDAAKQEALNALVDQKLLDQAIKKSEIEITDDDLARAIASVLQQNHITIDQLRQELSSKGISFESYKDGLRNEVKRAKFIQQNLAVNVQVSDQEIADLVKKQTGSAQKVTVTYEQVQIPVAAGINQKELKKAIKNAQSLTDTARKSGSFYPIASTKEGPVNTAELDPAVSNVLRNMESGMISDPIATNTTLYIVKLLEKKSENASTSMSQEQAQQTLYNQKMEQEMSHYVLQLRQKAYIDIRE